MFCHRVLRQRTVWGLVPPALERGVADLEALPKCGAKPVAESIGLEEPLLVDDQQLSTGSPESSSQR